MARSRRKRSKKRSAETRQPQQPAQSVPEQGRSGWRRAALVCVAIAVCAVIVVALVIRPWGAAVPRNLLLITLDTTRADRLSCYGSEVSSTPHLDWLAQEGALFTACTTPSPTTLPSHCSLMTSLYPFVLGVRSNGVNRLPPAAVTLAEHLKGAGFLTRATVASFVLSRRFGIDQGFDIYHEVAAEGPSASIHAERSGDEVREDAVRLMEAATDQRLFLWVHFFDAHSPYLSRGGFSTNSREAYAREVEFVDEQVGHLMAAVDRLGLAESTLTVVVGDHGEDLQDHGEATHGYFLYDTTVRVPLILHAPGAVPAGRHVDSRAGILDVAPTVLDLLGVDTLALAQGVSLVPTLHGRPGQALGVYSETVNPRSQLGLSMLRSLTQGHWKYILAPRPELYDLSQDAAEGDNAIDEQPDRAAEMRHQLRELIEKSPPPLEESQTRLALASGEVERLRALGYMEAAPVDSASGAESELELFEPRGADPKDHVDDHQRLVEAFVANQAGRFAEAESILRALLEEVPDSVQCHSDLALALRQQGRQAEAAEVLARGLELAPENRSLQAGHARALGASGQTDEAIEAWGRLLEDPMTQCMAHGELAKVFLAIKDGEGAEQHLRGALQCQPDNSRLLRMLGGLLIERGEVAEGVELLERAMEIDPGTPMDQMILRKLRLRAKSAPSAGGP